MSFAEWFTPLGKETLSLQILVAFRTFKTLAMIIIVQSLDPSVPSLYREATAHTLGCKEVIPIGLTVG